MDDSSEREQLLCRELKEGSYAQEDHEPLKHSLKKPKLLWTAGNPWGLGVSTQYFLPVQVIVKHTKQIQKIDPLRETIWSRATTLIKETS